MPNPNNYQFHGIKPYTLRWWMHMMDRAIEEKEVARILLSNEVYGENRQDFKDTHYKNIMRYISLYNFIYNRIIETYGESHD